MIYALKAIIVSKSGFNYTSNGIYTLLSIIWTVASIRLSNTIIEKAVIRYFDKTGLKKDLLPLIENLIKFMLILACLFGILIIWDIDIRPFIASAGIMSIIIALAAKDTFANFFGGISLFLDKPFKIGDYIELDNGQRGEVVDIGMRSTRIKTRDDILLSIPNSIIGNSLITNESAPIPQFRIRIPIGVAYGSEIDLVEKLLIEIAVANDNVIPDPAPRVRFRKFGESSLDYELLCWAKEPALRGLTVHELNSSIYKKFNETGIKIPYPQRDLHIKND
jgi:small-conductance mechanosensitive channel